MATFIDQFLPPVTGITPPAAAPVTPAPEDAAQLRNSLTDPNAMLMLNVARQRGNDLATDNQIVNDYQNMDPWTFSQRYGMTVARDMDMLTQGTTEVARLTNSRRSTGEHIGDAASGVATGLIGGIGDASTLVAGMLNEDAGRVVSDGTTEFRHFMEEYTQTNANNRNRAIGAVRSELDSQDNRNQYEEDLESGESGFEAGLSFLGRGLVNGAASFWEDPQSLETGLAEGVGSLFAGGYVGKGLGAVSRLAGMGSRSTKAMMPASIGMMEGGSAYSGALQQVMAMPIESLYETSPSFREMIASGMDPETAREAVAADAANIAALIQAPVGALTGRLVARFEAQPLGSRGFSDMVNNILRETVEEGTQSATGQLAQNLGVQQADENQFLLENVGEQTAKGAILGGLTAGVVQSPRVPGQTIRVVAERLRASSAKVEASNEAGSGVTDADFIATGTELAETVAPITEAVEAAVEAAPEIVRREIGASTLRERLNDMVVLGPTDRDALGTNVMEAITATGIEVKDKTSLILALATVAKGEDMSMAARQSAAFYLMNTMDQSTKLFSEDINEVMESMDQASPEYTAIQGFQSLIESLKSAKSVTDTLSWIVDNANIDIQDNVITSPEVVQTALRAARAMPSALEAKGASTLLAQATAGQIELSEVDTKVLQNVQRINEIADQADAMIKASNTELDLKTQDVSKPSTGGGINTPTGQGTPEPTLSENTVDVSDQVMRRGREEVWGLSADQHVARFETAISKGDVENAQAALRALGNFGWSQASKGNALIKSAREGGEQTFARLGSYGRPNPVDGKATFRSNSPAAVGFARQVIIEANMLADMFNALADAHPELNITRRMPLVERPTEIFGETLQDQVETPQPTRELNKVEKTFVSETFKTIVEMHGLPRDFGKNMKIIIEDKFLENAPKSLAMAFHTIEDGKMRISISHKMAGNIANNINPKMNAHALTHEFSHGVDFFYRDQQSGMPYSAAKDFAPDSIVMAELDAMMERDPENRAYYEAYILSNRGDVAFTRKEVFADLFAAFLRNPLMVQKELPQTFTIMENIADDAFGKNRVKAYVKATGTGSTGTTDPTALRSDQVKEVAGAVGTYGNVSVRVSTIGRLFPFLVRDKEGISRFHEAYMGDNVGPLLKRGQPLREMMQSTNTAEDMWSFIGEDATFEVTAEMMEGLNAYLELGRQLSEGTMPGGLLYNLKEWSKKDYSGKSNYQRIIDQDDVVGTVQGRALAILEQVSGGHQYNAPLLQTAMLASLFWFTQSQNRNVNLEKDDVARITGLDVDEISNDLLARLNMGVGQTEVARGMAQTIQQFWGLRSNPDAPSNLPVGIAEGVAKEILRTFIAAEFMTTEKVELPNGRSLTQYMFGANINPKIRSIMTQMGPAKKFLQMAAVPAKERVGATYNVKPTNVAKTQMRNKFVNNTAEQINVIKTAQGIAHNFYENSFLMQQRIGKDAWIKLMGGMVITPDTVMNDEHRKQIEGQNLTVTMAFDAMVEQHAELVAHAKTLGITDLAEINKYYEFNYSRVDRLQMLGDNTPQSSKVARHVYLPSKRVLDLTDTNSEQTQGFMMAIAQGLGVKNKDFTPEEQADMARSLVMDENGKYTGLVNELVSWMEDGRKGDLSQWAETARSVDPGLTEHGIMTLLSAAEYVMARDSGNGAGLAAFTTFNYFEADGVTNGPANALMNMTSEITPEWVETIRKAGSFIGHTDHSMLNQRGVDDLYTTSGNTLAEDQAVFAESLPEDVRKVHEALFRVMRGLGMTLTFTHNDNGDIVLNVNRKTMKNPLTITIYGSGINGIAGNVADEMMGMMYAAITEHMQSNTNSDFGDNIMLVNPDGFTKAVFDEDAVIDENNGVTPQSVTAVYGSKNLWNDLAYIIDNKVVDDKGKLIVVNEKNFRVNGVPRGDALKGFNLNRYEKAALRSNMRVMFVNNMVHAIDKTVMGHIKGMVDDIQKSTNAQSIIAHYMFRKELMKAMAERQVNKTKFPNYKKGDFLTQREMDKIIRKLMPYMARIDTQAQSFLLGAGEKSDLLSTQTIMVNGQEIKVNMPESFSRSLAGDMNTLSYSFAPSIAGVSGLASFNIGTGDGRMIDIFLGQLRARMQDTGVLPVFDGINLPVDKIAEGSKLANEAVMKSWQENPTKAVAEGFNAFMGLNPLMQLLDDTDPYNIEYQALLEDLTRNAEGIRKIKEVWHPSQLQTDLQAMAARLTERSSLIEDRIEAQKDFAWSVDQMAGGSAPMTQEGTIQLPPNATSADIAMALNERAKVKRAERLVKEAKQAKVDAREIAKIKRIDQPRRNFVRAFKEKAKLDTDTGVLVANISALQAIRKTLNNKLNNTDREMLNASIEALSDSDYTVVFGTPEMVNNFERNNFPDSYQNNADSYYGKIDVENRIIYLTNPSTETLSHELIHAATITKMQGFFEDKKLVTVADGEAITRLEGLMDQWMEATYDKEAPSTDTGLRMARGAINEYLSQGKKAEALNEFVAWSLSNQEIIKSQRKITVKNPILKIMGQALTALKQLIWGHKKAPALGTDMFSNVKFNTRILMKTPTKWELFFRDFGETVMFQSSSFGSSNRLSELRKSYAQHIASFVNTSTTPDTATDRVLKEGRKEQVKKALARYVVTANEMAIAFKFDMQQSSTFKMLGLMLSVAESINKASLDRMQDVFDTVIEKITVDDFLTNQGDPALDKVQAELKYRALLNGGLTNIDAKGRSGQLANFIALTTVDEQFREIIRGMEMPKEIVPTGWKPDAIVERFGAAMAANLSAYASGEGRNRPNLLAAMDALMDNMIENVGDQRSFIEQKADGLLDTADTMMQGYVEKGAAKTEKWLNTRKSPIGKKAGQLLSRLTKAMTVKGQASLNRTTNSYMNQPEFTTLHREVVTEIIGRTEENAPVFDQITRIRSFVDQTRQRWREDFPKTIAKWFKAPLTAEQKSALHVGIAHTGVAALFSTYRQNGTIELLSSGSRRAAEIAKLEIMLTPQMIAKAKQLATFMMTGDEGIMLQPNAYAIAKLNGDLKMEQTIDHLTSLYALDMAPDSVKDNLTNLAKNDKEGLFKIFAATVATYDTEMSKANTEAAKMNLRKGHLEGQHQEGVNLVLKPRSEHAKWTRMGYTDMGLYKGSSADVGREKMGYYFAPVSGNMKFMQGNLQTVRQTVFGVDPNNGYPVGELNGGIVSDPRAVAAINRRIDNSIATKENLRPIYSSTGVVTAFVRGANPDMKTHLNTTYNLGRALGAWRGRQFEEKTAQLVNEEQVDATHGIWERAKREGRANEFVRVDKSTDQIIRDAWNLIPKETKNYIKEKFGTEGFRVQRTMLNDVIGGRVASVGDFWTGNSRWDATTQKEIRDLIVGFGGNKAYRYLVNAESLFQELVTDAKVNIVIKSMVVPAANFISGVYQLSMHGVPIRHIFTGYKQKMAELNNYIKRLEMERNLEIDLQVAEGAQDLVKVRKLVARLQSLKDSYRNMSIWPLIEAGEYAAITESGLSQEDIAIAKGGYANLIDKLVNKLPAGPLRETGRYAAVTRDTSLFKAMSRATMYGDFLAKAILYDDLTNRKKMSQKEAIAFVNEDFINYNRFAGRGRAYGEAMGLTWFYHFKLRSMKISQRMMQLHPARALLHTAVIPRFPLLGSIGNPITDNFVSAMLDGRLGYTTGPGLLFRAPALNPWWNLTH